MYKRDKVNNYIKNCNSSPLKFTQYYPNFKHSIPIVSIEELEENTSLKELVKLVFAYSENYYSCNAVDDILETIPNKWRSSFDIWRHIRFYRPETSIFDVMNAIYEIAKEGAQSGNLKENNIISGQYCTGVKRRVFHLNELNSGWRLLDLDYPDEYGLLFEDWEKI